MQIYLLVPQFLPENPLGHLQVYESTPSTHVPPFWHIPGVQSSISWKRTKFLMITFLNISTFNIQKYHCKHKIIEKSNQF